MMAQETRIVGVDVSKRKIDACIRGLGLHRSLASTPEGRQALIAWLRANGADTVVMEASGGYERHWAAGLRAAGLKVRIVDPKRVKYFAKSAGRLAKNDRIDAETIAWFGETFPAGVALPHDPEREALDHLVKTRASLKDLESRIIQQDEHQQPSLVSKAHHRILKAMRTERRKLEAAIAAKIKANPVFARRAEIIESVPGLADLAAAGVIAWLPELGHVPDKVASALLGAAPFDDDSGQHKGKRFIKGGRRKLRNLLYMPLVGAVTQHNPVLKAHYQQLIARGKEPKVALIACMRKLIVILNTMLARDQLWNPPARATA
jgi:transposase